MVEVHLYGALRRVADVKSATSDSIVRARHEEGDTVSSIVRRIGLAVEELGSNLFVNGRYATLDTPVSDGDRLGLFPDDMQLLYKWYFAPSRSLAGPSCGSAESESNLETEA